MVLDNVTGNRLLAGAKLQDNSPRLVEDQDSRQPRSPFLAPGTWLLNPEFQKGGDPAAGSPTATLLRLHPSR